MASGAVQQIGLEVILSSGPPLRRSRTQKSEDLQGREG